MVYAAAPGTDTMALLALPISDSDSRGGFTVPGHIYGNPNSFDAVQNNVRQALFLGKKGAEWVEAQPRRPGPTKASSSIVAKGGLGLHETYRLARVLDTDVKATPPCTEGASACGTYSTAKSLSFPYIPASYLAKMSRLRDGGRRAPR